MSFSQTLARRDGALFIEDVPVRDLAEAHGTPLYVYSRAGLLERASRLLAAFGPDNLVAYSIKSNMNLAVVRTFVDAGCGVDVTSRGELERALRARADPRKIVYSGAGKRPDEIDRGLEAGLRMFNVESLDELAMIDARARAAGVVAPISFRLNPDVDARTHPKIATGLRTVKFGVPIEEAPAAYAHAKTLSNVEVVGVDCHIGSQLLSLEPMRDALLKLKTAVLSLRQAGHEIRLIDIGGGLGVEYQDGDVPPTPEEYADMALEVVGGLGAALVCEPGRSLTAGAGYLVSRVLYQKQNEQKSFVILDAGMNDYVRPAMYGSPVRVETESTRASAPVDLVGPVCESTDRFAEGYALPEVSNGDLVVFRDVGAYGFCMASTYNGRPLPAEVMVHGSRVERVRRRQSVEETWTGELQPQWDDEPTADDR
ncbi:MAG: diaminopimelate decarboxylase [Deltaproteobacteria bacterium]|nr:diaminopimelate decarboxylase [Deltaproteobacteria bacterium]MBW2414615.1 diaminopimelate decarboxylase [Deltaproteobacteria bacterium]